MSGIIGAEYKPIDVAQKTTNRFVECNNPPCLNNKMLHKCGFHAFKDKQNRQLTTTILNRKYSGKQPVFLTVELSGRIISHRDGYRAAQQRVLNIGIDSFCWLCYQESRSWEAQQYGKQLAKTELVIVSPDKPILTCCLPHAEQLMPKNVPSPWRGMSIRALQSKYGCEISVENHPLLLDNPSAKEYIANYATG